MTAPLVAFHAALAQLESQLSEGQWTAAGAAGEALASAVESCRQTGVTLSPAALNEARALFERCVTMTADWGQRLNEESQRAGNTSRALQNYRG